MKSTYMPSALLAPLLALAILTTACSGGEVPSGDAGPPRIELLARDGCPNTGLLEQGLRRVLEPLDAELSVVDQDGLDAEDPRRGWGTPTVLVDGADLFGAPPPSRPLPAPS